MYRFIPFFVFYILNLGAQFGYAQNSKKDVLWYNQPARAWIEALPLGNGKLGVMVFGNPINERIQLNDDSMWPGDPENWKEPSGNIRDIQLIRQFLFQGRNTEADRLFEQKFSNKGILRSHQTLGDLRIQFDHQQISDYRRDLNIENAISTTQYRVKGDLVTQEVFVSHPHKVIVVHLTSESNAGLNAKLKLSRPSDRGYETAKSFTDDDHLLYLRGEVTQRNARFQSRQMPITEGVLFESVLKVVHQGGQIIRSDDALELENVREATIYIVSNSSFYFDNYQLQNKIDLEKVLSVPYETIKSQHIADYQSLYKRVDVDFGDEALNEIPTDQRLLRVKNGQNDRGLEALLFQFGRYLLISSSRKGTNPPNLQGLWNEHIQAPWNGDYHLNINLQMNYWLSDVTNLSELNYPLFDFTDRLVENGKTTAMVNFGSRGTFFPHATDLWAPTWLQSTVFWGCSMGAGGWLMQHYWKHYEFTKDLDFLRERAFPAIHEVALFYSDWLIEDTRDGTLISAPSTSPENRYYNPQSGRVVATCLGSAKDQQVIYEVFSNYLKMCEILGYQNDLVNKIESQIERLRPGFVVGANGRILEWDREYREFEPGHRHMSHLYGFHPGNIITKEKDPELFNAVKKTVDYRLANGGGHTGWSRAWLINLGARLLDGDFAHRNVRLLFQKSMADNLFDLHPPFQIDGNFGYSAGIAEMLLQSHEEGIVRVLPAFPKSWENGYIKGLKARGGLTVDIYWQDNWLDRVIFHSEFDKNFTLLYRDKRVDIDMVAGQTYIYDYRPFRDLDQDGIPDQSDNCPNKANPEQKDIDNDGQGDICDVDSPNNISINKINTSCQGKADGELIIKTLADFQYHVVIKGPSEFQKEMDFKSSARITGLTTGLYTLSITAKEDPSYFVEFSKNIEEPQELSVQTLLNTKTGEVELIMDGAESYRVQLGDEQYEFDESNVKLPIDKQWTKIYVGTDNPCQGSFVKWLNVAPVGQVYPNPVADFLYVLFPEDLEFTIKIYNSFGKVIYTDESPKVDSTNRLPIPVGQFPSGMYIVSLKQQEKEELFKVLKQ
ncbi:MAG: glycoside hydrolase N-terminal domain-containing protein [Flavobacteriaceae bacterium]|nr:glycoside hydrolase N-terminal domain-containing protein [Flavobacteriaceae bacterium]